MVSARVNWNGHVILCALIDTDGNPTNPGGSATIAGVANAVAPTLIEGATGVPLSFDLNNGLRVSGSISATSAMKSNAADQVMVEGVTTNPVSCDLSGYQRVVAKQTGTWNIGLSAGTNLIGKVAIDATNPGVSNVIYASNLPAAVSVNTGVAGASVIRVVEASDGPVPTVLGSKTDAKNAATDGTSVSMMQVFKQISAYLAGSLAVTGTFWQAKQPVSAAASDFADGSHVSFGTKADAKASTTDATPITGISIWKQISFSIQAAAASLAGTLTVAAHGLIATATGGYTPGKLISAASTNGTVVKASAGTLGFVSVQNLNAAARYLKFYDKASAPTVGSDTPVLTLLIPGNTAGSGNNPAIPAQGLAFATGIAFALTTGIADTDNTAVAISEITVNYGYK